ncbi:MAG: hypothetical protein PVSMB1_17610 [Gemmatimonadaceae bacterium]
MRVALLAQLRTGWMTGRAIVLGAAAFGLLAAPQRATAQNLGPFRQFLAVEPYYSYLRLDAGEGQPRLDRSGFGGRLWINAAPFSGASWSVLSTSGIAFFGTHVPKQRQDDATLWHYGAQLDVFLQNRPIGDAIDPFVTLGGGVLRRSAAGFVANKFAFSPGGGFRIPFPNRFQLRVDARDAIVFNSPSGIGGSNRTAHNLEAQGALGITF